MPTPAPSRRVLRLPQVEEKTGLGHDSIYRLGREGSFPRPIKLSERASGWLEHEIDEWLEQRAAARGKREPAPRRTVRSLVTCDSAPAGLPILDDPKGRHG